MRAPEVGSFGVPCTHDSRHDGHREDELVPPEVLSAMVYGVLRSTRPLPVFSRPPRILGKGETVAQRPKGAGGEHQPRSTSGNLLSTSRNKGKMATKNFHADSLYFDPMDISAPARDVEARNRFGCTET